MLLLTPAFKNVSRVRLSKQTWQNLDFFHFRIYRPASEDNQIQLSWLLLHLKSVKDMFSTAI